LLNETELLAEAANYTTHNKSKRQISIASEEFEPSIPAIERLQTYAVDHTATEIV
jgi:hypothetical protein